MYGVPVASIVALYWVPLGEFGVVDHLVPSFQVPETARASRPRLRTLLPPKTVGE